MSVKRLLLAALTVVFFGWDFWNTNVSAQQEKPESSPPRQTLVWKGHVWKVTNGGMAGTVPGSGGNVFVDAKGYLHLKIARRGNEWTAAELFTTDKMGFGTYQWQIEGAIDAMAPTTVLGLFPYGPAAAVGVDGENELDIEFSQWNHTVPTNAGFTFYPPTSHRKVDAHGDAVATDNENFSFTLPDEKRTTARLIWRSNEVVGAVLPGLQPLSASVRVFHTHTYAPANPGAFLPQTALPVGINFWCFQAKPSREQEVVIRDFQYVPAREH